MDPTPVPTTLGAALDQAIAAYDGLVVLAEDVEDEWQYVQDLAGAWRERLSSVAADRGGAPVDGPVTAALARLAEEAGLIADPHQAIDWLSTYPQVALAAVGEPP